MFHKPGQKPLSKEFLLNLVKKVELKEVKFASVFSQDELKLIKSVVTNRTREFTMRNKPFKVRYSNWRNQEWATVGPKEGYVPMVSSPINDIQRAEEI